MKNLTWFQLALIAAAGSTALLAGAFTFQALGYAPCKMCIWQRYPHGVAMVVGLAILITRKQALAWVGALGALATSAIGFYHSGVERKLWSGPTSCTGSNTAGLSTDDLLNQIMEAPLVRCDEIPWEMFGVTMANLNALFSLGMAVLWVMAARR